MSPFLQLAFVIAIILLSAKIGGYLSTKLGQPAVLGELTVGLILGPSLIDLTHLFFISDVHLPEIVYELGELGVLMLMFLAGLELHISELASNTKVSAFSGILGVLVPAGLGYWIGSLYGLESSNAVFLGLTLGATSVSISAQTLMELKVLRSRVGLGLLGAAVFDDVLVILLLSTFTALASGGSAIEVLLVIGKMIAFLGLSVGFGYWFLPRLTRLAGQMPISQSVLTLSIVILLFYGLAAELIGGMAAITGTFIAGLMFGRTPEKNQIEAGMRAIAYAFFVPIFFVDIGLEVDISDLGTETILLLLIVSVVAIIGKILGSGLGARLGNYTWRESLQMGIGMVSRGEVGLIVATIGLSGGYLNNNTFSAIVGMVLLTTIITPPLLRASFRTKNKPLPLEEKSQLPGGNQ